MNDKMYHGKQLEVPMDVHKGTYGHLTKGGETDLNMRTYASPKWDRNRYTEEKASFVG